MSAHIGSGGSYKEIQAGAAGGGTAIGVGGSWKSVKGMWVGNGGVWKQFFEGLGQEFDMTTQVAGNGFSTGYDSVPNFSDTIIGSLSPNSFQGSIIETIVDSSSGSLWVFINGSLSQSFFQQITFVFSSSQAEFQSADASSFNVSGGNSIWEWGNAGINIVGGDSFKVYFK